MHLSVFSDPRDLTYTEIPPELNRPEGISLLNEVLVAYASSEMSFCRLSFASPSIIVTFSLLS